MEKQKGRGFKMFRRFFKKGKKVSYFIRNYEEGYVPCTSCREKHALASLTPLRLEKCSRCGNHNFVPLLIDRYWITNPLGGGGMGSVYKGYDREDPSIAVAVKLLPGDKEQEEQAVNALHREVDIAHAVGDHPSLAGGIKQGKVNDQNYAIMEFVHGERLDHVIEKKNRLSIDEVLRIGLDLLDADWYLYKHGYLYRDLKPQNIILTEQEKKAVLFDYGLCVLIEEAHNQEGDVCAGSPHFLPPERLQGRREDAYSEIYSLGMVMYYMLTGSTFFSADEAQKLANKHIAPLRIPMKGKLKGYPSEIVELLSKMTQKEEANRPQSFEEAQEAIQQAKEQLLGDQTS